MPLPASSAAHAQPHPASRACSVLVAPGLHGSGPMHWQSAWERRRSDFVRVEQADWSQPDLDAWSRNIVETALLQNHPVVVVAHSFGSLATVHAASYQSGLIAGALLVAPADPLKFGVEQRLPRQTLPFPTLMVASSSDPWFSATRAREWAELWGSSFANLGDAGHINVEAGFTDWPEGLALLEWLCQRVIARQRRMPERSRSGARHAAAA